MASSLITPAQLAAMLGVEEDQVLRWRRQYGWPSFKSGKTIRFTPEQVDQIIAKHSTAPKRDDKGAAVVINGQTKRSARRSA